MNYAWEDWTVEELWITHTAHQPLDAQQKKRTEFLAHVEVFAERRSVALSISLWTWFC